VLRILDALSIEEISQFPIHTIPGAITALETAQRNGWINGLRVVAVATGSYSATNLGQLNPDLLISDWESGSTSFVEFVNSLNV